MAWNLFGDVCDDGADSSILPPKSKSVRVQAGDANNNNTSDVDVTKNVEEAYECDYERDCTPLYRALENALEEEEFEPIIKFLDTGYWTGAFFSDSISPADQAKTWVTRFDPEDPNKVKWSQLPLHLAIVCNAPPSIIGRLVRLYPQALRCTDDQHMLPLHLALRHGSNDEIIAFLLMKFPDAVNAKGKNGRTAVDCALRAKDKLRGKILELFVEKTRGRKGHGILKEQRALRAELAAKDAKLEELKTDLEGMSKAFEEIKTLKAGTEQDLLLKIQQLEQTRAEIEAVYEDKLERMESEKVVESVMMQKKLEALQASHDEIQTSEKLMRMEESELRAELEKMQTKVSRSVSPEDLDLLKKEVEELRAFRLERSRSTTKTNIETLKSDLEKTMDETKKADEEIKEELKAELRALKKTVEKLASPKVAKTSGELNSLRNEVDTLRAELKERAESSKTKVELMSLKEAMESELKNSEGKTKEELAALRKAIDITADSEVKNKTSSELSVLKQELQSLRKEMKNKELINRTKRDLDEFKDTLATEIEEAPDSKTKVALSLLQKSADKLDDDLQQCNSGSQVIAVKQSIDGMKRDVKKRSITFKILCEAAILKNSVEASLNNAEGKTFDDLASMKKAVKALNEKELATKSVDDLNEIKISLVDIKSDLKDLEAATQAQLDLHAIKKTLQVESKSIHAKSDKETAMMKIAIDAVNMDATEAKDLKKSLASEIKENNTKIGNDLAAAKETLDGLDVKTLDRKDKAAWDRVRSEIAAAKKLVEDKMSSKDSVKAELELIKKTAEDKKKGESEYELLREEMQQMKVNMEKNTQEEAEIKKELDSIKKTNKKKKGLKKFFSRHFNASPRAEGNESAGLTTIDSHIPTIAPPSMAAADFSVHLEDSSQEEDSLASASLGGAFLTPEAPVVETVMTDQSLGTKTSKASKSSKKSAKTPQAVKTGPVTPTKTETSSDPKPPVPPKMSLAEKMRKVQSMDPRINSPKTDLKTVETKEDSIAPPSTTAAV